MDGSSSVDLVTRDLCVKTMHALDVSGDEIFVLCDDEIGYFYWSYVHLCVYYRG